MQNKMKAKFLIVTSLLLCMLCPATGMALPFEFGGKLGVESFNWRELDENGQTTEKETGARTVFSGFLHSKPEPEKMQLLIYGAEINLYGGTTDYFDTNAVNANSDYQSDWSGISIEGEVGLRVGRMPFAWEFVAKPGFDSWIRTVDEDMNEATRTVQAEEEQYQILSLGLGTGPAWRSGNWYGRIVAGVKTSSGLLTINADKSNVYDEDIEFDVEGKTTGFVTLSNRIRITKKLLMTFDGYYNAYHFKRSDTKTVNNDSPTPSTSDVTIPERKQRNYGVQAGISMDF
jgi:hypothetical protein